MQDVVDYVAFAVACQKPQTDHEIAALCFEVASAALGLPNKVLNALSEREPELVAPLSFEEMAEWDIIDDQSNFSFSRSQVIYYRAVPIVAERALAQLQRATNQAASQAATTASATAPVNAASQAAMAPVATAPDA